jgi:Tfp pilus assembly protein PilF
MSDSPKNKKKSTKTGTSTTSIIEIGLALHQQGQLELAREIYKTIKKSDPTYPESLHLIGVINLQQKNMRQL